MKKFKIKYQLGSDILVTEIEAEDIKQARYLFYMNRQADDILSIKEVTDSD